MIFISDLDKTLIFSKKHLPTTNDLYIAENKDKIPCSFIEKRTFDNLKKFSEHNIFIPATARTKEQYERIHIFNHLNTKYSIICNGKSILIDGQIDENWENLMNDKISKLPRQITPLFKEITEFSKKELPETEMKYYCYDNYLAMISFPKKEDLTVNFINNLNLLIKDSGWYAFACGRKLYISTSFINKKFALQYIKDELLKTDEKIVASGDSLYDLEMLEYSDFPIIPKHGEIANKLRTTNTVTFGGSYEISKYILELSK